MTDFTTFNIAKKLKEKGFREKCFGYYGWCEDIFYYNVIQNPVPSRQLTFKDLEERQNVYSENCRYDAPTIPQVLKWLRKEKHLHIELVAAAYGYNYIVSQTPEDGGTDYYSSAWEYAGPNDGGAWDSYEQAALAGIEYVLNNLI